MKKILNILYITRLLEKWTWFQCSHTCS